MPEKHFYFSIGAVVGSAVCAFVASKRHVWRKSSAFVQWLYRKEPQWFLYFPVVIFLVGLWGLIPDVVHLFGWLPKSETRTALFDVFFLHSTFEHIENTLPVIDRYLNMLGQLLLLVVSLSVMVYYVVQIKKALASSQQNDRKK
jgi:hypothetical protein